MTFSARSVLVFLFGALAFGGVSLAAPQDMSGYTDGPGSRPSRLVQKPSRVIPEYPSPVRPGQLSPLSTPLRRGVPGTVMIVRGADSSKPEYLGCLTTKGGMAALSREACSDNLALGKSSFWRSGKALTRAWS